MMSVGCMELIIVAVIGLGCLGAAAALVLAAMLPRRGAEGRPAGEVVRCSQCGSIRPAHDRYCGACGHELAPQKPAKI